MDLARSQIVRRLLGTATQLFIDDLDPVSVHCLASSAAEHASFLSTEKTGNSFNNHILETFPKKSIGEIRRLRNRDWNVIKHASDPKGNPIDPREALDGFEDQTNDATLFVVWLDYIAGGEPLPIEAQVFQVWYLELYPKKLDPKVVEHEGTTNEFPNLTNLSRAEQKRLLREKILQYRNNEELLSHVKTDARPLVLR